MSELTDDEQPSGYAVVRDVDQLKILPWYRRDQEPSWDRLYGEQLSSYYGTR